jgi:hypothetical protein
MEACLEVPITSDEATQIFGQFVDFKSEADFVDAVKVLKEKIKQAEAIKDAKQRALEISNRHPFSPLEKVAVAVPLPDGTYRAEIQDPLSV